MWKYYGRVRHGKTKDRNWDLGSPSRKGIRKHSGWSDTQGMFPSKGLELFEETRMFLESHVRKYRLLRTGCGFMCHH